MQRSPRKTKSMLQRKRDKAFWILVAGVISLFLLLSPYFQFVSAQDQSQQGREKISERAMQQIQALMNEKESRTPQQRKIDSQLLYALKKVTRQLPQEMPDLAVTVDVNSEGLVLIDINATVTTELLTKINQLGGRITFSSEEYQSIRANFPLINLEPLAESSEVKFIAPAAQAMTNGSHSEGTSSNSKSTTQTRKESSSVNPLQRPALPLPSKERAALVRRQLAGILPGLAWSKGNQNVSTPWLSGWNVFSSLAGSVVSEGDAAHRADEVRKLGITGARIRIGVLSDSVDHLAESQASGELGTVTVLPEQSGVGTCGIRPCSGEGTAMLEIIHDLAPGAQLYFATANGGLAHCATNIKDLRGAPYNCDIIVDDITYPNEGVFQDDIIARAVNEVVTSGALYFSSAGNSGNLNDGTSGVWEGDFVNGGTLDILPGGSVHDFGGGVVGNQILPSDQPTRSITLKWSDPLGASNNDYDLYILNSTLTSVIARSNTTQDGSQDPYEAIPSSVFSTGDRIVILRKNGAATRALHLNTNRGKLAIGTVGQTHGHNAAASAYTVAAVDAKLANGGSFVGGPTNPVETYSSDGPRRMFYEPNGSAITPGNVLFGTNGGRVLQKPDIAAADNVVTATPGFARFGGTSAAAPHAAAIAALVKSFNPSLTSEQIRSVLTSTAFDIEGAGIDRDSGFGIVMALQAIQAVPTVTPLTFSEFPIGTKISNQYQNIGIIFGGSGPFISTDGSNPTSPVLSGTPQFQGDITGTFVEPGTNRPTVVQSFTFDAGYFDEIGSTRIEWFDLKGKKLGQRINSKLGIEKFTIGGGNIASWKIGIVENEPAGFAIDNVSFQPIRSSVLFREKSDETKEGTWGRKSEIPGFDHSALQIGNLVYESHPGYPSGSYVSADGKESVLINQANGVQAQFSRATFKHDSMTPGVTAVTDFEEIPINEELAQKMRDKIESVRGTPFQSIDYSIDGLARTLAPAVQKGGNGSFTCVGLVEWSAEQAGHNGGQGFIRNSFESVTVPDLRNITIPLKTIEVPLLSPQLLNYAMRGQQLIQDAKQWIQGFFDPVDFVVTDPLGRRLGFVQGMGRFDEIPNAFYSGDGKVEQFLILNAIPGPYTIQRMGVGAEVFSAVGALGSTDSFVGPLAQSESRSQQMFVEPKAGAGGDVNGDGVVDAKDLTALNARLNRFTNGLGDPGDLNGDGLLSTPDVVLLTKLIQILQGNKAELSLTNTATPDPVAAGANLTYTIAVKNNGPNPASSVVVTDTLATTTTFVSCTSTHGGTCGGSGNNRTVTIPSLAAGETSTITLTVAVMGSVAAGTIIGNSAHVDTVTLDPNTNNNLAAVGVTVSGAQVEADVSPRADGDGKVTMADWVQLGRFYIGADTLIPSEFQRADCYPKETKGDGKITIGDWVQAGRYAAGLDPVVPTSGPTTPLLSPPSAIATKLSPASEVQARTVRVGNVNFPRGQIGTLPIEFDAEGNENAMAFSLNFDPKLLRYWDAKVGDEANGASLQVDTSQASNGRLGFALILPPGQQLAAGIRTLLTLRFLPSSGEGNVTTNLSFSDQLFPREIVSVLAAPVSQVNYTSGTITISGRAAANVSAASYVGAELAADSIASAFGTKLATMTVGAASTPLPNTLGGTTVKVKDAQGVERIAPLFFVSPNQINYQIPADTAEGIATVTITNGLGEVTLGLLNIGKVAPGIFAADASGKGWAAADVVYVKSDQSQVLERVARFDAGQNKFVPVPIDLRVDAAVLVLYGTGIRHRSDLANVKVTIGGVEAVIDYADKQGQFFGLDQINVRLPKSLLGRGEVPVEVSVEGKAANPVKVYLK